MAVLPVTVEQGFRPHLPALPGPRVPSSQYGHRQVQGPTVLSSRSQVLFSRSSWLLRKKALHSTTAFNRDEESQEQALKRRLQESQQVEERVTYINSVDELNDELQRAGNRLVVLEVQGESLCETGQSEEAELHWRDDKKKIEAERLLACRQIKHVFSRTARECPDAHFLELLVSDDAEGDALKELLGINVLPTIQFFRNSRLLWQQQGYLNMANQIGEGLLYYGDAGADGVKPSDWVKQLHGRDDLSTFLRESAADDMLTVVNVSTSDCLPCIRIYPAMTALAKNFAGHVRFARLLAEPAISDEGVQVMKELSVVEVPTFIFYRSGREIGRHVGSSRGDIIGKLLEFQAAYGGALPPPPAKKVVQRSNRSSRARGQR